MLVEDYRDPIAKQFALEILSLLDLTADPANGWIVDFGNDTYIQINGKHLTESVEQERHLYGFVCNQKRKHPVFNIYDVIKDPDAVFEMATSPEPLQFDETVGWVTREVYQSSDILFDPLNNVAIMNYLFTYIISDIFGPDYIREFCLVSVPGSKKTITRVILNDGQVINSRERFNDSIKLAEILGLMISDDIKMPDYGAYDFEIIKKKPSKKRR